jgi:hypothetical protein
MFHTKPIAVLLILMCREEAYYYYNASNPLIQ